MPRANRHYIPGYIWHITQRCHKREFLFKFAKDRQRWLYWLFEAKKRYGLSILNYIVTSNHVHLLVRDDGDRDTIPNSIQLTAGRTGQEYNQRKNRRGAFWEDRYHATAIEGDEHLIRCMIYIDTNMVRAGAVKHPKEWIHCGYYEIQNPRERYGLIDFPKLLALLQMKNLEELQGACEQWIDDALGSGNFVRDSKWTESIAVGSEGYIDATKQELGIKTKGRKVLGQDRETYELREPSAPYKDVFGTKKGDLRPENVYYWNDSA